MTYIDIHRRGSKVRYNFTLSAKRLFVNLKLQKIFCPDGVCFKVRFKFKFLLHASSQKHKMTKKKYGKQMWEKTKMQVINCSRKFLLF